MEKIYKVGPLHIRRQSQTRTDNVKGSDQHLDIRLGSFLLKLMVGPEARWGLQLGTSDPNDDDWTISFYYEDLYLEHAWTPSTEWAILPFREIVINGQHICWEFRTSHERSLAIHTPRRIEMSVPSLRWYTLINPEPWYAYVIDTSSIEAEKTQPGIVHYDYRLRS